MKYKMIVMNRFNNLKMEVDVLITMNQICVVKLTYIELAQTS